MHIKQITISNFRSFRQQPEIQPFHPGTNVVVGRNGSGKSNLFDAVQFALLAPKLAHLRQEERQALLHEGAGSTAVNAFCEIVFDNSDGRLSVDSDEVVLRRTIGLKKDEFFIQRKRATKKEIASLLEGAGFSKGNPYYIVQQGKVNALCTMSSADRLDLLKEVAGCTVYDEKRTDSLKQMEENKHSRDKINEVLDYIESRLSELQEEKEELTEYQRLDRKRRALEYTLYDKELRKAREQLDQIEHERSEEVQQLTVIHEKSHQVHDQIRAVETQMKQISNRMRKTRNAIKGSGTDGLETEYLTSITKKTQLELEIKELEESLAADKNMTEQYTKELSELQKRIAATEEELEKSIMPKYDLAQEVMLRYVREKTDATKKMEGLYARQGRGRQFRTQEDRDVFLQKQIEELDTTLAEKTQELANREDKLASLRRSIQSEDEATERKKADINQKTQMLSSLTNTLDNKRREMNEFAEERKSCWRSLEDLEEKLKEANESTNRFTSDLRKSMPHATAMGIEALKRIVSQENIPPHSYLGPVMENFQLVDPKFQTAVEVAAQNSLFHVIVDTDDTAAKLMGHLERQKLGRVTFLPLNRLKIESVSYPESAEVVSLLSRCIRYEPAVEKAMKHIFAKKLLAKSVDAASTFSLSHNMDAITLDGDLCSRKGALSGGYIDRGKSKLKAYYNLKEAQQNLRDQENQLRTLQRKATSVDQRISTLVAETERMEGKHASLLRNLEQMGKELDSAATHNETRKKQCAEQGDSLPKMQEEIRGIEASVASLKQEMGTALSDQLSEGEREMLNNLQKILKELDKEVEAQTFVVEEASVEKQRVKSLLDDNLLKQKVDLEGAIARVAAAGENSELAFGMFSPLRSGRAPVGAQTTAAHRKRQLDLCLRELEDTERSADETARKLAEAQEEERIGKQELVAAKSKLDELKTEDSACAQALEEAKELGERLLNKRSMCVSKREMYMRKIQELGSLPPSTELNEHANLGIQALMRSLETCNKELKKYSHVNKKAYDQYVNFSEQREDLLGRKVELDKGADKVKELIDSLDHQKDEAINRTFRGVSSHFKEVFQELVPNGAGELILRTAMDESLEKASEETPDAGTSDSEDETKSSSNPSVNLYRGVEIKVRFAAVGENYLMSQLSGGQKALVAMALIFAIQRCDPAPFYIFDELDQALDSTFRAAVANMIQRQSSNQENPTQFICSTFRPELAAVANRCYGISHQNKV
mmetsp:Transcript_23887/g.34260  ORF Transcript_23887/g.34260 Transcript_23887/m.34260 type:complete len:1231 (-) Transcript_23887:592-4284(-)